MIEWSNSPHHTTVDLHHTHAPQKQKQDQILDPNLYANRFEGDMADCRLRFVDQCGHVCHLEKPLAAAEAIVEFVTGRWVQSVCKKLLRRA